MSKGYKKKKLKCPVCGYPRLIDAEAGTISEMIPESRIQRGWLPDYLANRQRTWKTYLIFC